MPRKTDPFYDSFGTLSARAPTPMERMASALSQMVYGNDDRAGTQNMLSLLGSSGDKSSEGQLRDSLNPLAAIDAAYSSGRDIGEGDYLAGMAGLLAGALPIPAKRGIKQEADNLIRHAREAMNKYEHVGIRTADLPIDPAVPSRVWIDGEPTNDLLNGLSTTSAKNMDDALAMHLFNNSRHGYYPGRYTALLGSNEAADFGEDVGELILRNPTLLYQFTKD